MAELLDVGLEEVWALAARGDGLVPGAVAGDANVAREEESEDIGNLRGDENNSGICEESE